MHQPEPHRPGASHVAVGADPPAPEAADRPAPGGERLGRRPNRGLLARLGTLILVVLARLGTLSLVALRGPFLRRGMLRSVLVPPPLGDLALARPRSI